MKSIHFFWSCEQVLERGLLTDNGAPERERNGA